MADEAEAVLNNFAGTVTTWREIKDRCGFSDNEVSIALRDLQRRHLLRGDGLYGRPIEVLQPEEQP